MNDLGHQLIGAARIVSHAIGEAGRAIACAIRELKQDK